MSTIVFYVAMAVLGLRVLALVKRMEKTVSTNQQRLDAISTQLGAIAGQTKKAHSEIVAKIAALKAQASDLDFSSLENVVGQLGIASDALDSIVPDQIDAEDPTAPEPAPEPETDPMPPSDEGEGEGEGDPEPESEPEVKPKTSSRNRRK